MKNQREIALNIIKKVDSGEDLNNLIKEESSSLTSQELGFVKSLTFGTVRYKIRLDYIIKKLSKIPFRKIHEDILNIMRMSLYQLIYMDHIPDSAVVNEAVKLSKKFGNRGSVGFVNGSLRNFLRNKEKFLKIDEEKDEDILSIKYSFPKWIVNEIVKSYGKSNLEQILRELNEPSNFVIRANTLKISRLKLKEELEKLNFEVDLTEKSNYGLIINNPKGILDTSLYDEGMFYVQSESSQLVAQEIIDYKNHNSVLDLCASPGGKITHVYELLKGKGNFLAGDVNAEKLDIIKDNLKRLGSNNINLFINDGTILNEDLIDKFDLVIVDAPCSALGLIAKFPLIKYSKTLNDVKALSSIQKMILENSEKYLKNDGILIYSTCTFTKMENEEVIENFLKENPRISLEKEITKVNPIEFKSDGFTIGVMRKNG